MANGNGSIKFDSTISLGSVLHLLALLAAIFAAWNTFDKRLTIVEDKINVMGEIDKRTRRIDSYLLHKDPDYYRTADGDK